MVDKYILFADPFERRAGDIMMWRKLGRKKAARCLAFMLALSLIFPGTVYAASAMDIAPNEEVYGEYQDPSAGIPAAAQKTHVPSHPDTYYIMRLFA